MTWQNEISHVNKAANTAGRYVVVSAPSARDGISGALRSAYAPERNALPEDMLSLLSLLDK